MIKKTEKTNISIIKIILISFISIMLVSNFIIGSVIFNNWFAYANRGLIEIINRLDKDVFNVVDFYMDNHWTGVEDKEGLNNHLMMIVKDKHSMALVIDRNTGELIANSINIDNNLKLQDGTSSTRRIDDLGYPALTEAYHSYLNSNDTFYKLKNTDSRLYINISEYKAGEFDWLIFTAIPEIQSTTSVRQNIIFTIILAVIGLLITVLVYFYLVKKLLKPVDYLFEAAEKFTNGDLSQRVIIVRNDEIGMIAKDFNKMADTIFELVNDLENKVKERTLELERANEMMTDNRNYLKLILDSAAGGIYGIDTHGNCTFCNTSSIQMLGYNNQDELIGKNMHHQIHHSKRNGTLIPISECRIVKAAKEGTSFHADDEIFWRKDGSFFEVEYHIYPQIKNSEVIGVVVTFVDITESKEAQEQIEYLSSHDTVTGLHNRMYFDNEIIKIDKINNLPISIIYGDVNGLKLLNDIMGHEKGDELLQKTAEVLTRFCRDDDIVARIGGDEFVILLANTEEMDANMLIQRIKSELATEEISGIKGSISLGSDTKTNPEQDIKTVFKNAEAKMYSEKTLESRNVNSGMLNDIMESLFERSPREKLHAINVSRISSDIAINMKLPENDVKRVRDIGYYHDIGKIILNKDILNKLDKLNSEESKEMELHPLIGFRLLNLFNETMDIAEVVLTHHEKWDGTGYPKGLKGEEIPKFARIIAVAEGYDAMTNRIGGSGLTHKEAIEEIKSQSAIKYDPVIVTNFVDE